MSLLFADSFDHYETGDLTKKYSSVGANATIAANGRCSSNALVVDINPAFSGVIKGVSGSGATAIWGFALKITEADETGICSLLYGGSNVVSFIWSLTGGLFYSVNPDAAFPTYSVCTDSDVIRVGNWYYVEFKVAVSTGGAGTINVRVNGDDVTTGGQITGLTMVYSGWTGVAVGAASFGPIVYYDDLYISDVSGAAPWNDFLGDIRVEYLQPTANGATQEWDNTGGAAAWNSVDDAAAPDEDTSYISTSVQNEISTFTYEDSSLPTGATVFGVQMSFLAKKDEPGDRAIAAVVREGVSNYAHSTSLYPSDDSYDYKHVMMQVNPADSAAWAIADVNGDEFGVKVTV